MKIGSIATLRFDLPITYGFHRSIFVTYEEFFLGMYMNTYDQLIESILKVKLVIQDYRMIIAPYDVISIVVCRPHT